MFGKRLTPAQITESCGIDFMPLNEFINGERVKKYVVDQEAYNKSKRDILTALIKEKEREQKNLRNNKQ